MTTYILSNLIVDQINRIDAIITAHPISENEAIETKKITPEHFLNLYCIKELRILQKITVTQIQFSLSKFLNKTAAILKDINPKEPKFEEINRLCIFYVIAAECILSYNGEEDAIDGYGASDLLIQQSSSVLSNQYGIYNHYIQHNFTIFLSAVSSRSPNSYKTAFAKLNQEIASGKIQQTTKLLCMNMPLKVSLLTNFINEASQLTKIPSKFYDTFAQMITDTIILAFKRDITEFISFLKNKTCLQASANLRKQIEGWSKSNYGVWPSIVALQILMPTELETLKTLDSEENSLFKLTNFQKYRGAKKDMAIKAILTGFRAYALSNANQLIENLISNYYSTFFNYFLQNNNDLAHAKDIANYAFIDFPMCVLFKDPIDFKGQLLPIFEKPERWNYFTKIVFRVCKQFGITDSKNEISREHLEWQDSVLSVLLQPTVNIFNTSLTQPKNDINLHLQKLINAFTYYPNFLRKITFDNITNLVKILQAIENYETLASQRAFISFFDLKYADQADVNADLIMTYEVVLKFLLKIYYQVGLYRSTFLSDSIPDILLLMTENLFTLFLSNTNLSVKEANNVLQHTKSVVSFLETGAILFLASSKEDFRTQGAKIISLLVELYHTLLNINEKIDLFDGFLFPIEEYRGIDPHKKLRLASPIIKDALRSIGITNQAQKNAFQSLFISFLSLTKEIDPTIQLIYDSDKPLTQVKKPELILSDEWIGTFSIMLAILPDDDFNNVMRELKIILSCQNDLGAIAVSAVPTAIAPRYFFAISNMCLEWIAAADGPQGFVDSSTKFSTLVMNAMRMVRGLAEQKNWPIVEPGIFNHLLTVMVGYCDMIPGEDFRLACTKTIISVIKLLLSQNLNLDFTTRHHISKSLLGWLPTIANLSKEYNSTIHQCLALILDDLSLIDCIDNNDPKSPEEKVDALFMLYFASIKSRLDMKETTETDMVPVLAALLKRNLSVGIEHCLSMGFDSKDTVRAAFIGAVSAVFHIPEVKKSDTNNLINTNKNLIDFVLNGNWDFIEILCRSIPYSRADSFGKALVEAALMRGIGFDFIDRMIFAEVDNVEIEGKNTLFRGNAVPARAVGSIPRIIGTKWMKDIIKPIALEVIDNCRKGIHYVVDPSKLKPDQNIEDNRKNFKDLLYICLKRITESVSEMPKGLIRETQMIFTSVSRKYGDFAYQIIASFLFLRFLLPAFSVPTLLEMDSILPEEPRQTLLTVSKVLNVVTRSTQLNKEEYLIPFNDFAVEANEKFSEFFKTIVNEKLDTDAKKDNDEILKELNLDEKEIIRALHEELYPLLNQIRKIASEHEDGNMPSPMNPNQGPSNVSNAPTITNPSDNSNRNENNNNNNSNTNNVQIESLSIGKSAQRLADFLQSIGAPPKKNSKSDNRQGRRRQSTFIIPSSKEKMNIINQFNDLMSIQIPDDIHLLLRGFIKKADNPATDDTTILVVNVEKISQMKDTKFGPYFLFKALQEIKTPQATIICILKGFNEESIPTAAELEVLSKMPPIKLIKRVICLETSFSYVSFVTQNPSVLDYAPHVFPNSITNLSSLVGPQLNTIIPEYSLESISKPESVHKVSLVFSPTEVHDGQVKLFTNCVQITATPEIISSPNRPSSQILNQPQNYALQNDNNNNTGSNGNININNQNDSYLTKNDQPSRYYTIVPMTFMTFSELKFDKPIRQENQLEFSLYATKNEVRLRISDKSTLYDAIVNIVRRNQIMKTLSSKVKVDTSTLQWLMLNLAFVNVVNAGVVPNVLKASIGLIYVIFSSFEIKHNIEIINTNERLPSSLVGYVVSLSEDIAKNNPESFSGFLSEYFKVFSYVPKDSVSSTLLYLKPWVKLYVKDIKNHPKITENILIAFENCINASEAFCEHVLSVIMEEEEDNKDCNPVDVILRYAFENKKESLPKISVSFARLNSKKMTTFLVKTLLGEWNDKKDHDNNDIKFIWNSMSLLFMHDLFDENLIFDFVYHMLTIRFKFDHKILLECKNCFINSISRVSFKCKDNWEQKFGEEEAFYSFRCSLTPNIRGFYENCINIAKIYQKCCLSYIEKSESIASELFEKFKSDFYSNDSVDDKVKKTSSIINCAAFSIYKNPNEILDLMLNIMNENSNDDIILIAVTAALLFIYDSRSASTINKEFDAKLLLISIALCLRLRVSFCADLVCKVMNHLIKLIQEEKGENIDFELEEMKKLFSVEDLNKLQNLTGETPLPFVTNPIFSFFIVIVSSISDNLQFNSDSNQSTPSYSKQILKNNLESDNHLLETFIFCMNKAIKQKEDDSNQTQVNVESAAAIATVLLALSDSENQQILNTSLKIFRKKRIDSLLMVQSANPQIKTKIQKRSNEFFWAAIQKQASNQENKNIPSWINNHFCGKSENKNEVPNIPTPVTITNEQFLNVINYK